ncbi:MAG: hypothetical protein ACHQD8_04295 [Chitinophagales bacterium]
MKIAVRQAPFMILQDIHNHITAVNDKIREREPGDRCPTMEEVEKLRKLLGMTKLINKRNTGAYMETFGDLIKFATSRDRDFARKVALLVEEYVKGHFGDKQFDYNHNCSENVRRVNENLEKMKETADPVIFAPSAPESALNPKAGEGLSDEILERELRDFMGDQFDEKLFAEALNTPNDSSSLDTYVTSPSPFMERAGVRSGIFCDKNLPTGQAGATFSQPTEIPKNQSDTVSNQNSQDIKYPIPNNSGSETFSSQLQEIMKLPLAQRPSPFREGNILWVSNIDDVDERYNNFGQPWGERKMGDVIRRYPDIDPMLKRA